MYESVLCICVSLWEENTTKALQALTPKMNLKLPLTDISRKPKEE